MERLYVSDLDGTLLNQHAVLGKYTVKELNRMISSEHVNFTVATARNVYTVMDMFKDVELVLPVIEFNGSFITDIKTGEKLVVNSIRHDISDKFMKLCDEYGQFPLISGFDGKCNRLYYKSGISDGMDMYLNDRKKSNQGFLVSAEENNAYIDEEIVCYTLINTSEKLDKLVEEIEKEYGQNLSIFYNRDIYYTDWHWASIYSSEAKKGCAIKKLIDLLGLKDCILTVFGDHNNDMDMFDAADVSVAVANAQGFLKEKADVIIGSNTEDSIVKYIAKDLCTTS